MNERILVASIIVVTKTITEERNVVTITPASIKRSGVAPARPRASLYTARVATSAPVNATTGRIHSFVPKKISAIIVPTAAPLHVSRQSSKYAHQLDRTHGDGNGHRQADCSARPVHFGNSP